MVPHVIDYLTLALSNNIIILVYIYACTIIIKYVISHNIPNFIIGGRKKKWKVKREYYAKCLITKFRLYWKKKETFTNNCSPPPPPPQKIKFIQLYIYIYLYCLFWYLVLSPQVLSTSFWVETSRRVFKNELESNVD